MKKIYLIIFIIALIFTGCQKTSSQDSNVDSTKICTDYPAGFDPHNNNLWQAAILRADVAKKNRRLILRRKCNEESKRIL